MTPFGLDRARLRQVWRYYQAGIVNTLFGFGLYALLVRVGLGIYVAQAIAQVLGVAFNYVTYSRHVFRDAGPAKLRFMLSYIGNYLVSLGALAASAQVIRSPYVAGLAAVIMVSLLNYLVLKHVVFVRRAAG